MTTSCSNCYGKNCGLKEMLSCKTRQISEENKGLIRRMEEYMRKNSEQSDEIENLKKVLEPILNVNLKGTFHLSDDCIVAVQEAQKLHKELIVSEF